MFFYFTPCYFQLKIVITQPESGQLLPWHPQDLHAYMYSALRWCLNGPSNIAMLLGSFRILPYLSNRYADIHVDVSSIGQKKFYFFLPKTIWRFHQVVPAPLLSSDKSFLSCSSYLCSEKISSKFHSISISSWLWTRITLITSRSFSVSNFWIPKKSFSFILSESSFCSRSKS